MQLTVLASLLLIVAFQAVDGSCIGKDVLVVVGYGKRLSGDGLARPDPYVVLKIGSVTQTTKVIHSNANPTWWTKFRFNNVASNDLHIKVMDSDSGIRGRDDLVGMCNGSMDRGTGKFQAIRCKVPYNGFVELYYKCR